MSTGAAKRCVPPAAPRGVGGVLGHRATGTSGSLNSPAPVRPRIANRSAKVASTVRIRCGNRHRDRGPPPADLGIGGHRSRCGNGQFSRHLGQRANQVRGMVQVHQAQQAFHDRDTRSR